jgi:hypothetical protein
MEELLGDEFLRKKLSKKDKDINDQFEPCQ